MDRTPDPRVAFIDACVLYPNLVREVVLRVAEVIDGCELQVRDQRNAREQRRTGTEVDGVQTSDATPRKCPKGATG